MIVRVEFYAALREVTGTAAADVELAEGSTVDELLDVFFERFPALREWDARLLLAADLDYVERTHVIREGEIISVMPPVQGG